MSTLKRLVSGSQASWVRIAIGFVAQILLIPIFLSHWDTETYGVWIAILAISSLICFVDIGHQAFIGFDALRIGAKSRNNIAKLFYSSLPIAFVLSLIQLCLVVGAVLSGLHSSLLGLAGEVDGKLESQAGTALILNSAIWLLVGNWSTIAGRILAPYGYYPRIAWWQVLQALMMVLFPCGFVILGAGLLETVIAYNLAYLLVGVPAIIDICRLLRKENIKPVRPDFNMGFANLLKSFVISLKSVLEMIRQQHVRVILAPLIGVAELVKFVTIRTGANILLQGLGTITQPLLPELMHFLHDKDQERTKSAICFVWFVLIAFLVPCAILAQWLMPYIFSIWTRGQVAFDPLLFALFTLSVLFFALAQPAMAIIQGNNILQPQIVISAFAALLLILGVFIAVPHFGIRGVAASLLLADAVALIFYIKIARRWLAENGLFWPDKAMYVSIFSVLMATVTICIIVLFKKYEFLVVICSLLLVLYLIGIYWQEVTPIARVRVANYIGMLLPESIAKRIEKNIV